MICRVSRDDTIYNGNGSDGGAVPFDANSYLVNDTVTVLGNTGGLVKTGHSFTGWNTASDGSGAAYTSGSTFTMGTSGVLLFAQWLPDTYTISYDGNGATSGTAPAPQPKTFGVDLVLSGNTGGLARSGFHFVGWNTAANGSGQSFAAGATFNLNQNTTLYAQWNAPPHVSAGSNQTIALSGSVAWSPSDIPTVVWFDASDTQTISEAGGLVSQWSDKSSLGTNHATQGTSGNRPISGTKSIGDKNAIDFHAANTQFLNMPSVDVIGKEVWAVYSLDDYTTTASQLLLGAGGNVQIGVNSSTQKLRLWAATNPYSADTTSTATVPVATPTFAGWLAHTDTKKFSINGVLETTTNTYVSPRTLPVTYVGRGQYAYMDGAIGEIIITGGTLSIENRQRMEGYLAHKWGLAGELPSGHPHEASVPGGPTAVVNLNGTASDPEGDSITTLWRVISGPADVAFANPAALQTTATFTAVGTYVLELAADDGTSQATSQITIIVTDGSQPTFASWISGYNGLGGLTAFGDDADGDGIKNAVENYFGTHPGEASPGIVAVASGNNSFVFSHPLNSNPASDLTAGYRWSKDLVTFHADGASHQGTTVNFQQGAPVAGVVTVTATVTGTSLERLFIDVEVTRD